MIFEVTINNNIYEVDVDETEARVRKTGETAQVKQAAPAVTAPAAVQPKQETAPVSSAGGDKVTAPIAGVILDVKKNRGEAIKKGEILFIIEAMKMENEIFSPKDAVVADITVAKGASVNTGDLIAVLQ